LLELKFVTFDVGMLIFAKNNAVFSICFNGKGVSNPQGRFGVGQTGKIVIEVVISCFGISLLAGSV
jgi:hypothetical protein